jgi:hypothetical protein
MGKQESRRLSASRPPAHIPVQYISFCRKYELESSSHFHNSIASQTRTPSDDVSSLVTTEDEEDFHQEVLSSRGSYIMFKNVIVPTLLFVVFLSLEVRKPRGGTDILVLLAIKLCGASFFYCIAMIAPINNGEDTTITKVDGFMSRRLKILLLYILSWVYCLDLGFDLWTRWR